MTRTLLVIVAVGLGVCLASFSAMHLFGAVSWHMGHRHHHHGRDHSDYTPETTRDLPWTGTETLHIDNSAAVVTYIQGPTPKFTVSGPKSRIDALGISGDTLTGSDIHWHLTDDDDDTIHITITSPKTHAFFLSGAEQLTLTNYDQDDLELNISGTASVHAVGHAKHADISLSGAGRLDLAALPVDDLKVHLAGASSATVDPKQSADISIAGAGHVGLLTRPPNLHTSISGIGSITTPDGRQSGHDKNDKDDD